MKPILNIISCENIKIYNQTKYRIYPIIITLIILAGAIISGGQGSVLGFTMSNYSYSVLYMISYIFAPIAIFMLVSDIMSSEMASDEIKVLLTRPISRVNILIGKILAVLIYIGLIFLLGSILSTVLAIVFSGFASFSILNSIIVYIVGFLPMIALVSMAIMISTIAKSGTTCFCMCLFSYLGFMVLEVVFSNISAGIFTSYLNIGNMLVGSVIPVYNLLIGIAILIGYSLIFLSLGGIKFVEKGF